MTRPIDGMDEFIMRMQEKARECELLGIEERIQPDDLGDSVSFGMLKYMQGLEATPGCEIDHRVLQFIIAPLASHVGRLERRIAELEAIIGILGVG